MDNSKELQENKDPITDGIPKKIEESVLAVCEKFKYEIMRCVNCPIILECKYPKKRLDTLREEADKVSKDIYEEEIELDNSAENILRAQNKKEQIYNDYIKNNAMKVLKNDRCLFERKEILEALTKFVNAGYDISDPRVSLITNELIGNILNSGRSNKSFTSLGVLLRKETAAGPVYYQNPLLKTKMEFSKLIIEATEALDRILKSDETVRADKTFTDHLIKELKLREKKKNKLIESVADTDENNE